MKLLTKEQEQEHYAYVNLTRLPQLPQFPFVSDMLTCMRQCYTAPPSGPDFSVALPDLQRAQ